MSKKKMEITSNFVVISENLNFTCHEEKKLNLYPKKLTLKVKLRKMVKTDWFEYNK